MPVSARKPTGDPIHRCAVEGPVEQRAHPGAASGEFVAVEPIVVKGILGMFNHSYLWLRPGRGLSPEAIADLFVNVLERGLDPNR